MSPVPNDNPITPLIRRSSNSTSSIIELNSRRRKYHNHNFYPTTTNLHRSCRATDYPTTTNLHQGCRATEADCGTSRPFIALHTTARQQGEDSKRCAARGTMERGST